MCEKFIKNEIALSRKQTKIAGVTLHFIFQSYNKISYQSLNLFLAVTQLLYCMPWHF